MRFFNIPTQDTTIYEQYSWKNTGLDEILEVGKDSSGIFRIRSLLQFDIASISSSFSSGLFPINTQFDLQLYIANVTNLKVGQAINIEIVSSSWVEGSGYFYQNLNSPFSSSLNPSVGYFEYDGATWLNRSSGSLWQNSGSDFYTGSIISQSAQNPIVDMTINITSFIQTLVSGTLENDGFILKFPDADENDNKNAGNIKFFSKQTHTVYSPQLIAKWDDSLYITGSLSGSSPAQVIVVPKTIKTKYKVNELTRVDLSVRDRYPIKTFDTLFTSYAGNQYLPTSSFFSVIDTQSNTVIIPFDNYSKISCDGTGSYFNLNVQGVYPGRFYKLQIKVINGSYEQIFDDGYFFSVEAV